MEKRNYLRVDKNLPIKLSYSDFDIVTETKNISGNGAYCAVDKPLEIMTKLSIVVLIPIKNRLKKNGSSKVKKIICSGVVVRTCYVENNGRYPYHMGIYFNDMTERDRESLLCYINNFTPSV